MSQQPLELGVTAVEEEEEVRVEGKEMLSEMRSIDNRTSENASFGGIFIIGIPQPVPFTKKRGVINNCNDGQLWGEI